MMNIRQKKIYVVIAYRWGDCENHSYLVGTTFRKDNAIKMAQKENEYRGGKYTCTVYEVLNGVWDDQNRHINVVNY